MSFKPRAKKSLRKKTTFSFDEDEEDEQEEPTSMLPKTGSAQAAREREKRPIKSSSSLLSFGEDGGPLPAVTEAGDKLAKSNSRPSSATGTRKGSLKVQGIQVAPNAGREEKLSTQVSAPGEYSKEKLQELARGQKKLPAAAKPPTPTGAFKLAGSFKPPSAKAVADDRFAYNPAALLRHTPAASKATNAPVTAAKPVTEPAAAGALGPEGVPASAAEDFDSGCVIPDASTIQRVKEKRERLRSAHLAPDYVPLGGTAALIQQKAGTDAAQGSDNEDDPEDHMRIAVAGAVHKNRRGPVLAATSHHVEEVEVSDEDNEWAQEQIRKGLGTARISAPTQGSQANGGRGNDANGDEGGAAPFPGSSGRAIAEHAEEVMCALREGLKRLQASQESTRKQLTKVNGDVDASVRALETYEQQWKSIDQRYKDVQQLRAYIADLCDMLKVRSPYVEVLEERLWDLAAARAAAYRERCERQSAEELELGGEAMRAVLGVMSRGDSMQQARAAAERALTAAEDKLLTQRMPVQLDEFGRDENVQRRNELRQRLARMREAATAVDQSGDMDGSACDTYDVSSAESESEIAQYKTRRQEILQAGDAIFTDAGDEYSSLEAVQTQLAGVKAKHRSMYRDAYLGDSAPALFAPFVRLQLLEWDPLYAAGDGFGQQEWFEQLWEYGRDPTQGGAANGVGGPEGGQGPAGANDSDDQVVPTLVANLVLPMALHRIKHCWSPTSVRQSEGVAVAIQDLAIFDNIAKEQAMQELLSVLQDKLMSAISKCTFPPWPPAATKVHPRFRATLQQKFGRATRVLRSILAFLPVLPEAVTKKLALHELVQGKLVPHLKSMALEPGQGVPLLHKLVLLLPYEWFNVDTLKLCPGLADCLKLMSDAVRQQRSLLGNQAASLQVRLEEVAEKLGAS